MKFLPPRGLPLWLRASNAEKPPKTYAADADSLKDLSDLNTPKAAACQRLFLSKQSIIFLAKTDNIKYNTSIFYPSIAMLESNT